MKAIDRYAVSLVLLVTLSAPASIAVAQTTPPPPSPEPPLSVAPDATSDAAAYAQDFKVSVEEASRRLTLQGEAGELEARLRDEQPATFAGVMIEHRPQFRITVGFTTGASQQVADLQVSPQLASVLQPREAAVSLSALEEAQRVSVDLIRRLGVELEAGIDLRSGRVKLYLPPSTVVQTALRTGGLVLPELADIISVERLGQLEATVVGGRAMVVSDGTFCTSGFTVRNSSGTRGVLTAAHCPNQLAYEGSWTVFQAERQSTGGSVAYDVQWHTTPGQPPTNQVYVGTSTNRSITSTRPRAQQNFGGYACKFGWATGYTCGTITTNNYYAFGQYGWVYVDNTQGYPNLSEGSDSGAPWLLNGIALGIHAGTPGADYNDALYMAIDNISTLNVSVLTTP